MKRVLFAVGIMLTTAMLAVGPILAAQQGELSGTTYTITVGEGETVTLNDDDVTALGAGNTLVKTGLGTLINNCDLGKTYDGEIIVRQGFLRPTCGGSTSTYRGLGGTTKGTTVESGATLEMVGASGQNECANGEPLTFEGTGVNGCGAVYRYSGSSTDYALFAGSAIKMSGDATVGSKTSGRWFRVRNTAIDMQGYTLTFQNSDEYNGFKGGGGTGPVTNPGNIIVDEGAGFGLENANAYIATGDASNKLILKANAKFCQFVAVKGRCAWTMQVDGAAKVYQSTSAGTFGWNGPIVLNDTLTIESANATSPLEFNGTVSGTGAIVYSGTGLTKMNGGATRENTYTGGTTFSGGCNVVLAAPGLLPTAGSLTVGAAVKLLFQPQVAGDTAFYTDETVTALSRRLMPFVDRTSEVYIAGSDASWPESFTDALPVDGTQSPVAYSGFLTNAVGRFTGTMAGAVDIKVRPKTLVSVAATAATEGYVEVNGGALAIPQDVTLTVSNRVFVGGADLTQIGRLKIEGTLDFNHKDKGWRGISAASQALTANVRTAERGVVEICPGATVNGNLGLNQGGCTNGTAQRLSSSGLYLVKGTVNSTAEAFVGDFRSEYLEVAQGGVLNTSGMRTGRGVGAYAHLRVTAGGSLLRVSNPVAGISLAYNGGQTDFLVDGGRVVQPDASIVLNNAEGTQTGAYTALTICDNGEMRFPNTSSGAGWNGCVVNSCNDSTVYLNLLDGGLLETAPLNRTIDRSGNRVVVSFDGGTYAMRYNSNSVYQNHNCFYNFVEGTGAACDHVFVFSKGATISNDTPTYVGFTLEAPTGKGIDAIALPDEIADMPDWGMVGPPMVRITDTTGFGASAVAIYDSSKGRVTSIRVTSRGVNYTNPTITLSKGGLAAVAAKSYTDCCTLSDKVSGGFTKTGVGTLFVTNRMAYAGTTTVRQGTLKLGLDNALDSSSNIVVKSGATLDLNAKACTPLITGFGTVVGNVTLPTDWTIDAAELNAATTSFTATGNLTIPNGTTLTIDHPENLDVTKKYVVASAGGTLVGDIPTLVCASDQKWGLAKRGNQLVLRVERGCLLLVK